MRNLKLRDLLGMPDHNPFPARPPSLEEFPFVKEEE